MTSSRRRVAGDRWTLRARPAFLYMMYGLLLWSVPLGLVGGVRPDVAAGIIRAMRAYFNALPEPLYALFGTGYLAIRRRGPGGRRRG